MTFRNWRVGLMVLAASTALAGCLPDAQEAAPVSPAPAEDPPNRAPTISGTPVATATVGAAWSFQPVAADADGDVLSFNATGLPGWVNLNLQNGAISGTPSAADAGTTAAIVISVSDGEATASLPPFSITVTAPTSPPPGPEPTPPPPANTAPVISGTPSATVQATQPYVFTPSASDAETQSLTFSITNRPAWASFSTATGVLSGTPSASQAGTYGNIRISVSDGSLTASLPVFSITVTAAPNRAPTISGTPASTVTAGTAYSFRPTASDPDGQRLTFSISNRPAWASFSTSTGTLSGTPADAHVGTTSDIVIRVSDGTETVSLAPFSITVNARANRAPTVSGTPATSVTVGGDYQFRPTADDPDGDELSWTINGKPTDAVFSAATGELTWTPSAAGTWSNIVITVADAQGATASLPAFTITVAPPATTGTAELSWSPPTQYTDGSALPGSQIVAYYIYQGASASNLTRIAEVDGNDTSFTVRDLASGTHYFAVTTVATGMVESAFSAVGSKTIN
jgi:hypothetical protein